MISCTFVLSSQNSVMRHKPLYKCFVLWKLFELYSESCRIWITNWNVVRSYWFDMIRHDYALWRRSLVEKEIFRVNNFLNCSKFKVDILLDCLNKLHLFATDMHESIGYTCIFNTNVYKGFTVILFQWVFWQFQCCIL